MSKSFSRVFTNSSGGTISVNETGLYWDYVSNSSGTYCFYRAILANEIQVLNGYKLQVTYTTEITFPA
jgi:hypothetical protein